MTETSVKKSAMRASLMMMPPHRREPACTRTPPRASGSTRCRPGQQASADPRRQTSLGWGCRPCSAGGLEADVAALRVNRTDHLVNGRDELFVREASEVAVDQPLVVGNHAFDPPRQAHELEAL